MSWDAVVVGGGLAGSAAAGRLAMAGRRVVLIERERGPHDKVCGEFLSGEAEEELAALDLHLARHGAAPITAVRLVAGRTVAAADLPFAAWGLSRRRLDELLLDDAARRGAVVKRGAAVKVTQSRRRGRAGRDRWRRQLVRCAALLATGKHELRGWRRARVSTSIGLKLHLHLADSQRRALAGSVELTLFAGGYAGLQLVEDGMANLCLVVSRNRFASLGRDWRRLVAAVPHLTSRLSDARAVQTRPLAVAGMPYGWLAEGDAGAPVYRLGDQAAVIPSFTGDGMAMALRSARYAADAIAAGQSASDFQFALTQAFRRPVRLAGLLATLTQAPATQHLLAMAGRFAPGLLARIAAGTRLNRRELDPSLRPAS